MFAEAEKQNEEINVWSERNERERGRNELLQEMAQTGLFEKVKESYLKDVDRGLSFAETPQKNGQ